MIAWLFAIVALFQGVTAPPPPEFIMAMFQTGQVEWTSTFIGVQFACPYEANLAPTNTDVEYCYSGLVWWDADTANGGPHWSLETGP